MLTFTKTREEVRDAARERIVEVDAWLERLDGVDWADLLHAPEVDPACWRRRVLTVARDTFAAVYDHVEVDHRPCDCSDCRAVCTCGCNSVHLTTKELLKLFTPRGYGNEHAVFQTVCADIEGREAHAAAKDGAQ